MRAATADAPPVEPGADPIDQALTAGGSATARDGTTVTFDKVLPADMIPLVIQDKTFVPADIALQDSRWSTSATARFTLE